MFRYTVPPTPSKLFLYDQAVHLADETFFQSNALDTNNTDIWYQCYDEMRIAAYDSSLLEIPDTVFIDAAQFYADTIVMGFMDYFYYYLKSDALTTNNYFDFDTTNTILTDKTGRASEPYLEDNIFMVAPLMEESKFSTVTYKIDQNFIFKDNFTAYDQGAKYFIDFGDGGGYQQFFTNQNAYYKAAYSSIGEYYIHTLLLDTVNNDTLKSSYSRVYISSAEPNIPADEIINANGIKGYVFKSDCGNDDEKKYIVYVEGFDPLDKIPFLGRDASQIYNEMIISIQDSTERSLAQLMNYDYDYVIVDWKNSSQDMKTNADNLIDFLDTLQCRLTDQNHHQFVIIGESMGGVIARYALTKMENQSMAYSCRDDISHNTRLLITLDSPHEGANVPLAYQHLYQSIGNLPIFGMSLKIASKTMSLFLDSKAAKQMLIYHASTRVSPGYYYPHNDKTSFDSDMLDIGGRPSYCKMVALSNGSLSGIHQIDPYSSSQRNANDVIFSNNFSLDAKILGATLTIYEHDIDVNTNPTGYGNLIYYGITNWRHKIRLKLFGFIFKSLSNYITIYNYNAYNTKAYCVMPGGYYDLGIEISGIGRNNCSSSDKFFGLKGVAGINIASTTCSNGFGFNFIPVQSALAFSGFGSLDPDHNIEAENISWKLNQTPFDVIIAMAGDKDGNKQHLHIRNDKIDDNTTCGWVNRRQVLNLEIGDERIYLENLELNRPAQIETEYDIIINDRNPYYNYVSQSSSYSLSAGHYSKENDFIISGNGKGKVEFICDIGGGGTFQYNPPITGSYLQTDQPLYVCCTDYRQYNARYMPSTPKKRSGKLNPELSIYPNPAAKRVSLEYVFYQDNLVEFKLLDIHGREIIGKQLFTELGKKQQLYIELPQLKSGVYLVRLQGANASISKKLVIQH